MVDGGWSIVDGRWREGFDMQTTIFAQIVWIPARGAVKLMPTVASPDYVGHCVSNCL